MSNSSLPDQELLEEIVEAIPHAIVVFQPEGRIIFANPFARQLLGLEKQELESTPVASLFMENDREILLPNIVKLTMEKGTFAGELLLRGPDNRQVFAHMTTHRCQRRDTELVIATIQDIGTLKALERNSSESDRLRCIGKVVDQMAHHIRNPIAAIGGFAARLLKGRLSDKDRRLYEEIIFHEATRLDGLLRSLANFTNLPLPALAEETAEELLDRALALVSEELRARALIWDTPAAEELRPLRAFMDKELMAQCLANVITNSLEAEAASLAIIIRARAAGNHLQLRVTDNGSGIAAEDLPLVFDPLFTTKDGHVGLGLTISQRIIEDHEGSITIESDAGLGTTVTMGIPRERRRPIRLRRF